MSEETIFHQVLALPPGERATFLDSACGADKQLRVRLEALLRAHENPGSFLRQPVLDLDATAPSGPGRSTDGPGLAAASSAPTGEGVGSRVGPYTLVRPLGEGGMGTVWLAEQTHPVRRSVALKLVRPGLDSQAIMARFEAERQALALMDHPHIAKVFDAGTTASGRPYFVMELVEGVPLTKYCDEQRLTPRQRLELLVPVCRAVQHAHQKGIIHRDLKPSNILVTLYDGRPSPKVIDFGVAKATGGQLSERTLLTEFGSVIGTLEYMSPEQTELSQLDVDTRSDIYALGVVLYELLTGDTPLSRQRLREVALLEVLRLIREEEPPRPSTRLSTIADLPSIAAQRGLEAGRLSRMVRGELDWIVMKCLEKDRNRRYDTANGLARDLERYLADEPVLACPPSAGYRLRKFARRHKGPVLAALVVVLALLGGISGTTAGLIEADSAWREAVANEGKARQAAGTAEQANRQLQRQQHNLKIQQQQTQAALDRETEARNKLAAAYDALKEALYFQSIALADRDWWLNYVARAEQALDDCPPELRHWEWYYLKRRCRSALLTLRLPLETRGVAFSRDGQWIATVTDQGQAHAQIWDARTGRLVRLFAGLLGKAPAPGKPGGGPASAIALSPDGRQLAAASGKRSGPGSILIWDTEQGQRARTIPLPERSAVTCLGFSADGGQLLATGLLGDLRGAKVWDAASGSEQLAVDLGKGVAWHGAFSPNGRYIAAISHSGAGLAAVHLVDAATGKQLWSLERGKVKPKGVAFSPDSRRLAVTWEDGIIKVYDMTTRAEVLSLPAAGGDIPGLREENLASDSGLAITFSPDGRRLAAGFSDRTVRLWDAVSGRPLLTLRGHTQQVRYVAFSADSRRLASFALGDSVKIWDTTPEEPPPKSSYFIHELLRADGRLLRVVPRDRPAGKPWNLSEYTVTDARTGQELFTLKSPDGSPMHVFAPPVTGGMLATYTFSTSPARIQDRSVWLWDARDGRLLHTLPAPGHSGRLALSPDGRACAIPGVDRTVRVWLTDRDKARHLPDWQAAHGIHGLALGPDGKYLATTSSTTGKVRLQVLDTASGVAWLAVTEHSTVQALLFSPDGRQLACAGREGQVTVWEPQTGKKLLTLRPHGSGASSLAYTPNSHRLAAGYQDGTIKIWDPASGREILSLHGHRGSVMQMAFTPDGHRLVTRGSGEHLVRIWEGSPGPLPPVASGQINPALLKLRLRVIEGAKGLRPRAP
ncbi:MAG: serine/threonine protein kinase [Gemmataceae bacterium]|nr:serine/threonine protein kinase [Gemmataceae bacterium]